MLPRESQNTPRRERREERTGRLAKLHVIQVVGRGKHLWWGSGKHLLVGRDTHLFERSAALERGGELPKQVVVEIQ